MHISVLQKEIHAIAVEKGWHDKTKPRTIGDLIALCHEELSEALRCYRNHPDITQIWYGDDIDGHEKPEGFVIELADCVIRILDMAELYQLDLEDAIIDKIRYNKTRGHRHGNKTI